MQQKSAKRIFSSLGSRQIK